MTRATAILVAILVVAAVVPASATAAENDTESVLDSVLSADAGTIISSAIGTASGLSDRVMNAWAARSDEKTPEQHADQLQSTFNSNNQTIQSYINQRTNASTSSDVLEITLTEEDEGSSTVYLVATVNGSDYEQAQIVDSTSRTADESCTLEDAAARNADEELQTFVDKFATDGKNTTATYRSQLVAEYGGKIDCSFLN